MDTLQKQINTLNSKIDTLYQLVDQMGTNLAQVLTEVQQAPDYGSRGNFGSSNYGSRYAYIGKRSGDASMEHKDILADGVSLDANSQGAERTLSPEVQIQRLTAQLTAAYNRIAALEEQLLAQRIH